MVSAKQRHGCLIAALVMLIVGYGLLFSLYFLTAVLLSNTDKAMSLHMSFAYCGMAAINILCAIGIFRWRKSGFYGLVAVNLLASMLNLAGGRILFAVMCLIPTVILYFVLHIGDDNQGWYQLE